MSTIPQDTLAVSLFSRYDGASPMKAAFIFEGFYHRGWNRGGPIPDIDVEGQHRASQDTSALIARDDSPSPKMASINFVSTEATPHLTDGMIAGRTSHARDSKGEQQHRGGIAG